MASVSIESQVRDELTVLRSGPNELWEMVQYYPRPISDTNRRDAEHRTRTLLASLVEARQQAEGKLRPYLQEDPGTPDEQVLQELRLARAWARALRLLEREMEPRAVINAMAGNQTQLRALREELPLYLLSAGKFERTPELLELIDQIELPLLRDDQRQARRIDREIAIGWERFREALTAAKAYLNGEPVAEMWSWSGKRLPMPTDSTPS